MSEYTWLAMYSALILVLSLMGGCLPFLGKVTHNRLQLYLSVSAGVMLGAAFFHLMPDAMEQSGVAFGWWMSLGVVGLFCIERFIAPHSHELDGGHHGHHHEHGHGAEGEHGHGHEHAHEVSKDHRAAAPSVAGWMAVLGLTIHTFMNGVGLAGSVAKAFEPESLSLAAAAFPGFAMFLAIFLHKPADALAISTVLSRKGTSKQKILLVQLGFVLMVPLGAIAFYVTKQQIAKEMEGQLTGAALAFSAGTFLFIALSDLLPEVQFHRHDRIPLFLALLLGVGFMGGIAYLEGHEHGHGGHGQHHGHEKPDHDHDDKDDDHDKDHHHH